MITPKLLGFLSSLCVWDVSRSKKHEKDSSFNARKTLKGNASVIGIEMRNDDIFVGEESKSKTLNDFLGEKLLEKPIALDILKPILLYFEEWLRPQEEPEFAFGRVLNFYDPRMKREEQG